MADVTAKLAAVVAALREWSCELEVASDERAEKVARAVIAAYEQAQAEQWQPIETAPKDGRKLVLSYTNSHGKHRTVFGCWVTDEEAAETDADGVGLEAGWYELIDNWPDYTQVAIHEGKPTHWMPLPQPPKENNHE